MNPTDLDTLPTPLVDAAWLLAHRHRPHLRLLDCRFDLTDPGAGEAAYREGHLPGAVYAHLEHHLSGPRQPGGVGGRHPLPDPLVFAAWLGSVGVAGDSEVVVYDDPGAGQGFYAARAWWLLRWLGHVRVAVLNGGLPAYRAAGGTLTAAVPAHHPARFVPHPNPGMVASRAEVAALSGNREAGTLLLDSRAPERYRGEVEPLDARAGHIPGAVNRPWNAALDGQGRYRPAAEQRERLGVGNAPTVAYCGSGVSAAPNLLARELAGVPLGPNNRLYPGSWSEWSADPENPVVTGKEP